MKVEVELDDDDFVDQLITKSLLSLMRDMLEETTEQVPLFSTNKEKEASKRMKLLKAARLVHNYHSVHDKHINKDFSNL